MEFVKRLKPVREDNTPRYVRDERTTVGSRNINAYMDSDGYVYYRPTSEEEALACAKEIKYERSVYSPESLNVGQRRIYDYVHENPNSMIIIQAGPGAYN